MIPIYLAIAFAFMKNQNGRKRRVGLNAGVSIFDSTYFVQLRMICIDSFR